MPIFATARPRASYTAASNQIAALSSIPANAQNDQELHTRRGQPRRRRGGDAAKLAALFEMLDDFELMFDMVMPGGAKTIWRQG
jgi:alkyl sulfatase BDS1-like metallo-beta-lactamase superfamily hydrolase